MIHDVKLSPLIERTLSEVVKVQMALLSYGASTDNPSQDTCANYLHDQGFDNSNPTRSIKIADWIWKSNRSGPLTGFASGPKDDKRGLVERLRYETELLSANPPVGTISIFDIPERSHGSRQMQAKSWQRHGADFLQRFYDELSTSKTGLPAYLFSDPDSKNFRRQIFLSAFVAENKALYVCAVCDNSGSYTISNNKIYTNIEHYFPQSLYPHLSCHPYNLIPICHLCNSAIHGDKDPLKPVSGSARLRLEDIVLPYRGLGLGTVTRLIVAQDDAAQSATFADLVSTVPGNSYKTQIDTFARVYEIPQHWNEQNGIDKVGELLFRRMRHFLRGTYELSISNSPESIWSVLQYALYQLVYSLHTQGEEGYKGGDFGKDPFAFAMKWLLVTILNEETLFAGQDNGSALNFPLLNELARWLGQEVNDKDEYLECAKMLIKMLDEK